MGQPPRPAGLSPIGRKLVLLAAVALLAIVVHWLLAPRADPLNRFPHAFIAQAGYDPAAVVTMVAPLSQPPAAPEGTAPAWCCDVPPFADAQGRPWLFPMAVGTEGAPVPPVHPDLHAAPPLKSCKPFMTAEGARLLAAFKEGLAR